MKLSIVDVFVEVVQAGLPVELAPLVRFAAELLRELLVVGRPSADSAGNGMKPGPDRRREHGAEAAVDVAADAASTVS